tara:strand:- start:473 stop:631 length:159 start_codon:yes stop_codon:yes gene_type:complete
MRYSECSPEPCNQQFAGDTCAAHTHRNATRELMFGRFAESGVDRQAIEMKMD